MYYDRYVLGEGYNDYLGFDEHDPYDPFEGEGADMTIWIEDRGRQFFGHEWIISSERHDGISYTADSQKEAVRKYEQDRRCKVDKVVKI